MPTTTFFRLPEEKRRRLEQAAWAEFTRVSFSDVSINQIIRAAHIPRGSFYQYFLDKEDLFRYLLGDMHKYYVGVLERILEDAGGDLFAVPVAAFDRFIIRDGSTDPGLMRCVQVMRINQGMDMQWLLSDKRGLPIDNLEDRVRLTGFRRRDAQYVGHVFFLLVAGLAFAIMETLEAPERREEQREILEQRVEIIKYGSLALGEAQARTLEGGDPC